MAASTLRIFAADEVRVGNLGSQKRLTVACIIVELATASMRRAVAVGGELSFAEGLIPQVAKHIATQATSCPVHSIGQALEPRRLARWHPSVAALRLLLAPATTPIDELAVDVSEIIAEMVDSPSDCFSASLLQPCSEAMPRINCAFQSMPSGKKSNVLFRVADDEENAPENAAANAPLEPAGTPPRKKRRQDACEAEGGWTPSALHSLQESVQKLADGISRRYEVEDGRHGDVVQAIQFSTAQQASGFARVDRGIGSLGTIALQGLQNLAALADSTANEQQAAQAHREQTARDGEMLRAMAKSIPSSFSAVLEAVTKCQFTYSLTHDTTSHPYFLLTTRPGGGSGAREPGGAPQGHGGRGVHATRARRGGEDGQPHTRRHARSHARARAAHTRAVGAARRRRRRAARHLARRGAQRRRGGQRAARRAARAGGAQRGSRAKHCAAAQAARPAAQQAASSPPAARGGARRSPVYAARDGAGGPDELRRGARAAAAAPGRQQARGHRLRLAEVGRGAGGEP